MAGDKWSKSINFRAKEPFFPFEIRRISDEAYISVWCDEHSRAEWVPRDEYHEDIGNWYSLGLHPKFSSRKALLGAGQNSAEIGMVTGEGFGDHVDAARSVFLKALSASRTSEEFLENLHPVLFTDLRTGDRNSRVTNAFKKKFDAKAFTVEEFLAEENQELRRLIIRSGLPIKDVLARMKLIAEDGEGELYEMDRPGTVTRVQQLPPFAAQENEPLRYLHVTCPSTGAEYLLEVPLFIQTERATVPLDSPKVARRWTFDLPPDAEFIKEA